MAAAVIVLCYRMVEVGVKLHGVFADADTMLDLQTALDADLNTWAASPTMARDRCRRMAKLYSPVYTFTYASPDVARLHIMAQILANNA